MRRASVNLGIGASRRSVEEEHDGTDAQLKIENERLKTTLMILNQKMKVKEDEDDIKDRIKSQVEARDEQICKLHEELASLTDLCDS